METADSIKSMYALYYETANLCAEEVIKRMKDREDQESILAQLRDAVKKVNALENNTRKESAALDEIKEDIEQNVDAIPSADIAQMLTEKLENMRSSKSWTGALKDFDAHIERAREYIDLEDMIVQVSDNQIDPYSKKPIEHPVKSKFCNHAFDKTTVVTILATQTKNGELRCPYIGCNKWFTANDLVDIRGRDEDEDEDEDRD